MYAGGYGWVLVSIFQVPTAFVALALLGKKFAILSRKLDLVTITDFLRLRYEHPAVVIVSSVGVVLFLVAYMVPQFVGGARVLQAVTGVNYNALLITFAGVVLLYTAFGGFLADAISDTFQGVLMLVGGAVVWVVLLSALGGLGPVNETVTDINPDLFTLPGPGGFTPQMIASYSLQLGLMFCVLPHLAVRAMSYQRLQGRPSRDGRRPRHHGGHHPRIPHHGPGVTRLPSGPRGRRHGTAADPAGRPPRRCGRRVVRGAAGRDHVDGRLDDSRRQRRHRA